MERVLQYLHNNMGTCAVCIRSSFQAAVAFFVATCVLSLIDAENFGKLTLVVSVGFSALWLAHVLTYASRVSAYVSVGPNAALPSLRYFFQNLGFIIGETAVLYRTPATDRFGRPLSGRVALVELKNMDGTRTAYLKTNDDITALTIELKSRGYIGDVLSEDYWMTNNDCSRSDAKQCSSNKCDDSSQTCKLIGGNFNYCKCS